MGRITEFFDYIRTKTNLKEREELYTYMSINDKIKKARKEYLKRKRGTKWKMHTTLVTTQMPGMTKD